MDETNVKFDEIWSFIEKKLKTPVPAYFKYILHYCGYDNGISIATIEDDDINHFVNEVRNGNVSSFFQPILGDLDVLNGSTKTIENFEFSRGHKKYLMSIVAFLKSYIEQNGPEFTIKVSSKKKSIKTNQKASKYSNLPPKSKSTNQSAIEIRQNNEISHKNGKQDSFEKQKSVLIRKMLTSLIFHTGKLYARNEIMINEKISELIVVVENVKKFDDKFASLSDEQSLENTKEPSKKIVVYTADMYCPYCWIPITVFYVTKGAPRWNSGNFDRHLKLMHPEDQDVKADYIDTKELESHDDTAPDQNRKAADIVTQDVESYRRGVEDNKIQSDEMDSQYIDSQYGEIQNESKNQEIRNKNANSDEIRNIEVRDDVLTSGLTEKTQDSENENFEQTFHREHRKEREIRHSESINIERQFTVSFDTDTNSGSHNDSEVHDIDKHELEQSIKSKIPFELSVNDVDQNMDKSLKNDECLIIPKPLPKTGEFVIFSISENSKTWPEDTPAIKHFVGQVIRITENTGKKVDNSQLTEEVELIIFQKSRYSKFIFINPKTTKVCIVQKNRILMILQSPSTNRRGEFVFKDQVLSDYII